MKRAALVLAAVLAGPAWARAQTPVDQKRPAAADGKVTIENMAGSVKVTGWDRAEVQVKGTVGSGGELSFDGSEKQTTIEVEAEHGNPMGIKSDLEVFVPSGSSVSIEGFAASISVAGVTGSVSAETVNGSITQTGAAKGVELQSVNGAIDVTKASGRLKAEAVNGTVTVRDASGELEASTVNGKLLVTGGSFDRAALESVSGGVRFEAGLSAQGHALGRIGERLGGPLPPRRLRRGVLGVHLQRRDHERARPGGREVEPVDAPEGAVVHDRLRRSADHRGDPLRLRQHPQAAVVSFLGTPVGRVPRNPHLESPEERQP